MQLTLCKSKCTGKEKGLGKRERERWRQSSEVKEEGKESRSNACLKGWKKSDSQLLGGDLRI